MNATKLDIIDAVSSFHFPINPRYKSLYEGDFRKAFSGICTAGYTLQSTWTALYSSFKNSSKKPLSLHQINKSPINHHKHA